MINIWNYKDVNKIRIIDVEDKVFEGKIIDLTDVEEQSKDYGYDEDSITIVTSDNKYIEFPQSDIKKVVILD